MAGLKDWDLRFISERRDSTMKRIFSCGNETERSYETAKETRNSGHMRRRNSQFFQLCEGAPLRREGPRELIVGEATAAAEASSTDVVNVEPIAAAKQRGKTEQWI